MIYKLPTFNSLYVCWAFVLFCLPSVFAGCYSNCNSAYLRNNRVPNYETCILIQFNQKIPLSIHYPQMNKTENALFRYGPLRRLQAYGLYLSTQSNSTEAIIQYESDQDTLVFTYNKKMKFIDSECGGWYELGIENLKLIYCSNDSLHFNNPTLYLP